MLICYCVAKTYAYSKRKIRSFVRGAHAYQEHWQPRIGQVLNLKKEPENCRYKSTVAIIKADDRTVGHIPYNFAPLRYGRNHWEKDQLRHWVWN